VLHDEECLVRLLKDLSINVTEMFRDPSFFRALRVKVFPQLRTYPFLRIWVAGCSTGEEVISLAVALCEEDLLERTRIYATDMNDAALHRARRFAVPAAELTTYEDNYARAGREALPAARLMRCDLVAIGASWGGLAALQTLLCGLDGDFAAPICVAQHRSPRADDTLLPSLLGRRTALTVRDAEDKAHLRPGTV